MKINIISAIPLISPIEFEINYPNISLTIFDENNKKIYTSKNNSTNKAKIIQLKNNRYVALKPLKNKFIKLDTTSKNFSNKN